MGGRKIIYFIRVVQTITLKLCWYIIIMCIRETRGNCNWAGKQHWVGQEEWMVVVGRHVLFYSVTCVTIKCTLLADLFFAQYNVYNGNNINIRLIYYFGYWGIKARTLVSGPNSIFGIMVAN